MAVCLDYAKIAYAAYFAGTRQYYEDPPGHMVDAWVVQKWKSDTGLFGNGFQGGIWQDDKELVVGCCGTNPKEKGKFIKDLFNDLEIGFRMIPTQASTARRMVKIAKAIAGSRPVSITGHSLGGGLAQVVGVWEQVPFVTFNAPAMQRVIKTFGSRIMDRPGVNFRIRGLGLDGTVRDDPVSMHGIAGGHVGMVVDLGAASSTGAHGKNTCWQAVLATDWAFIDPFGAV